MQVKHIKQSNAAKYLWHLYNTHILLHSHTDHTDFESPQTRGAALASYDVQSFLTWLEKLGFQMLKKRLFIKQTKLNEI